MFHGCLVNNFFSAAVAWDWACCFVLAVASFFLSCSRAGEDFVVVVLHDGSYIFCAAVAYFNCSPIDDFGQLAAYWKVFVD